MKYSVDILLLEITRDCNMCCEFCLRGDATHSRMSAKTIAATLKHFDYIRTIQFTGGEPSLYPEAMTVALNCCKGFNIPVGSFYVVTNGKVVPDTFLKICDGWYDYCINCNCPVNEEVYPQDLITPAGQLNIDEYTYCGVALSGDTYHEPIPFRNVAKLASRSYFRGDKLYGKGLATVLARGRGVNIRGAEDRQVESELTFYDDHMIGTVYVNAFGEILADCDLSYDTQDEYVIGNVYNPDIFERCYQRSLD